MANAIPIRLADAVVSQINGNSFAIGTFTAVRSSGSWDKDFKDLTERDVPHVDVVYRKRGSTIDMNARGSIAYTVEILAVVRKRFGQIDRVNSTGEIKTSAVDPLDTLLIDIAKLFIGRRNTGVLDDETEAKLVAPDLTPSLANEGYLRRGLYYGFVPLVFVMREDL